MAVTIFEALENANYNLQNAAMPFQVEIAKDQLKNAVTLLEKGYDLHDEIEPLLEEHGSLDSVPAKA